MLLRVAVACLRVRQIQLKSRLVTDIETATMIRESDQIQSPVVMGWWQPCILLPPQWRDWTTAKRAAVLSHELSHVQRRDTQLGFISELVTAFYWFHPVIWLVRRNLGRLAELACDESAAITTGNRITYARYLIEVAASNRILRIHRHGIAMAQTSQIKPRVKALLDMSKPLSPGVSWTSLARILSFGMPMVVLIGVVHIAPASSNESGISVDAKNNQKNPAAAKEQAPPALAPSSQAVGSEMPLMK